MTVFALTIHVQTLNNMGGATAHWILHTYIYMFDSIVMLAQALHSRTFCSQLLKGRGSRRQNSAKPLQHSNEGPVKQNIEELHNLDLAITAAVNKVSHTSPRAEIQESRQSFWEGVVGQEASQPLSHKTCQHV